MGGANVSLDSQILGYYFPAQNFKQMKKNIVLIILFVLPIVAYLFFASGVTNFGKLPILTENIPDVSTLNNSVTFKNRITVLGFLGNKPSKNKGNAFNLNQKIYKRFFEFTDFQFVMLVPKGGEKEIEELKKELGNLTNIEKWKFIFAEDTQIIDLFDSLKTDLSLDSNLATSYVFVIDKDQSLRGRDKDKEEGTKYGFNSTSVADLNNKMVDDVKIILAEYRLALKKNNAERN